MWIPWVRRPTGHGSRVRNATTIALVLLLGAILVAAVVQLSSI